jgi:hypothetical protein
MTDTALNAIKRAALVSFCLLLVAALGLVFTRVVAARVPEQRATLEKLITDRTGLAVRFDNVHFAWGLDGTSAVFTRVELNDPKSGRVRVVAPELRVEFDTWDFLRHQQFSLGHVTLSSPDIEIMGDIDERVAATPVTRNRRASPPPVDDEAALVRRMTSWAELMPNGRIEVEGARVHLLDRGQSFDSKGATRRSFTLSQAVINRGPGTFNAYGTMLLAQDVGQSLFVSAKLENLAARGRVAGELRVIARRVFLDKLPFAGLSGRGTLDARLRLQDGRLASGSWLASARELAVDGETGPRFDHLTMNGKLSRDGDDLLLDLTDLQLTRGARLERAPSVAARLAFEPRTTRIARTTVRAERLPFMAGELVAGLLAPQLAAAQPAAGGWTAAAGELHDLHFDSGERRRSAGTWRFSARVEGAELTRTANHSRFAQLGGHLNFDAHELTIDFDPRASVSLRAGLASLPRALVLGGRIVIAPGARALRFDEFSMKSGAATLVASGAWDAALAAPPLALTLANVDRALLADSWVLIRGAAPEPEPLARLAAAQVVDGKLVLVAARAADGALEVAWPRSRGTLQLAALTSADSEAPRLIDGIGTLAFARGATQLKLTAGHIEDLALTQARLDWPWQGAPRLAASLAGDLASPLIRRVLAAEGLDRLSGAVTLEAEARGERELHQPDAWRVNARISGASVPLAQGLPPIEKLAGTLRYSNGQLRALALSGAWLGGPVALESRRAARGQLTFALNGSANAVPLIRLLGDVAVAHEVTGQIDWSGTAQRATADAPWQLALTSTLVGVESALPESFGKARSRALPLKAQFHLEADGIHDFALEGDEFSIHGEMESGVTRARFELPGIAGNLRRGAESAARTEIAIERLESGRAPAALAVVAALLPAASELALNIGELRQGEHSLGAMHAAITRTVDGLAFSFGSAEPALHRISAQGTCSGVEARCRAEFTADTAQLAALLRGVSLPAELPAERLHASGELSWPLASGDLATAIEGRFDLETEGRDASHQLVANATLADGQIRLDNVEGTGPEADQVFRGSGRLGLVARDYDVTVDYEQMGVAAAAIPSPARARLARAWSALRGSAARRGWAEVPDTQRVQWHGYW